MGWGGEGQREGGRERENTPPRDNGGKKAETDCFLMCNNLPCKIVTRIVWW